ncbi:hypothetical protein BUALT_Bualt03G0120500 [Buddleja alternifolia]|uniref:DNA helicase n=1 Tax=Buddleja alternifolia TaxID=168488 RepID=A0AAV6XUQ2_9LAMI|nr:hypothetical protein BUALT_Bualt03G0120500 [Buddleja alternifolia]
MQLLTLTENMRAKSDPFFSQFLLRVGNGTEPTDEEGNINIPGDMVIKCDENDEDGSEQRLIDTIFPNLEYNAQSSTYMTNRAILASKNDYVDKLNERIIQSFPGVVRTFTSFDEVVDDTQNYYQSEFLNSLTPNGMPPHRLVLKKNCPIMLLRNLDPSDGLCNGIRMVCRDFNDNVIHAKITVGHHSGKHVFIPRIPLSPAENEGYPFQFRRKQFPVRLCFAMTINKAQGQTIPFVGVYLPQPVFSHGQLYVALSRGTAMSNTKVLIKLNSIRYIGETRTKNVIYSEVLNKGNAQIGLSNATQPDKAKDIERTHSSSSNERDSEDNPKVISWKDHLTLALLPICSKPLSVQQNQNRGIENSTPEIIPINSLHRDQKDVTVKVMVLRQGSSRPSKENSKGIDYESQGTKIHGVVFVNALQQFEKDFILHKTYIISNPIVNETNKKYPNVNPEIELVLQPTTRVAEVEQKLNCKSMKYMFLDFGDVKASSDENEIDVLGFVKKVKQSFQFVRNDSSIGYRREVVLINHLRGSTKIDIHNCFIAQPNISSNNQPHFLERARIEGVRIKLEAETGGHKLSSTQWAKAAGISTRNLDKILCNGRESEERITSCYHRLVVSVASSYQGKGLSLQDLTHEGSIGLLRGAIKFNPERGYKLSTYAYWWIRQSITRALAKKSKIIRLPGSVTEVVPRICEANDGLSRRLRRFSTYDEIAEAINVETSVVGLATQRNRSPISLDQDITSRADMEYCKCLGDGCQEAWASTRSNISAWKMNAMRLGHGKGKNYSEHSELFALWSIILFVRQLYLVQFTLSSCKFSCGISHSDT